MPNQQQTPQQKIYENILNQKYNPAKKLIKNTPNVVLNDTFSTVLNSNSFLPKNRSQIQKLTPLTYAIINQQNNFALFLLKQAQVDCNVEAIELGTPLDLSLDFSSEKVTQKLIEEGAKPNQGNVLHKAIAKQKYNIAHRLIEMGADPHKPSDKDSLSTPFAIALTHKPLNVEFLEYLIQEKQVDVNQKRLSGGEQTNILSTMILSSHQEAVEFLLNHDIDPNVGVEKPLAVAMMRDDSQSSYKNTDIIDRLFKTKNFNLQANLIHDENRRYNALHLAVAQNKKDLVQKILEKEPSLINSEGEGLDLENNRVTQITALHIAATAGRSRNMVELLLNYGADPFKPTSKGELPLHLAVNSDNSQFNIDRARNQFNQHIISGERPQHFFQVKGKTNKHGVQKIDATIARRKQIDPIKVEVATEGARKLIVQLLLAKDPEKKTIQATTHTQDTPLHIAVRNIAPIERLEESAKQIIRMLIGAGAKLDILNQAGETPLSLAELAEPEIRKLMEKQLHIKNTALQAIANREKVTEISAAETQLSPSLGNR